MPYFDIHCIIVSTFLMLISCVVWNSLGQKFDWTKFTLGTANSLSVQQNKMPHWAIYGVL